MMSCVGLQSFLQVYNDEGRVLHCCTANVFTIDERCGYVKPTLYPL